MEKLKEIWEKFIYHNYNFWFGDIKPIPNRFKFQKLYNILFLFAILLLFNNAVQTELNSNTVQTELNETIKPIDDWLNNNTVQTELNKSITDDWFLIRSIQGEWVVYDDDGNTTDDHCIYEFFYSKR